MGNLNYYRDSVKAVDIRRNDLVVNVSRDEGMLVKDVTRVNGSAVRIDLAEGTSITCPLGTWIEIYLSY